MKISDSQARAMRDRFRRIIALTKCDPADTRTMDLLRLARRDLQIFDKQLNRDKKSIHP